MERNEIAILKTKGYSAPDIARALSKDRTTIWRELNRNQKKFSKQKRQRRKQKTIVYDPRLAQIKYRNRRRQAKYAGMKIHCHDGLKNYIVEKLKKEWSPETIAGRMQTDGQPFYVSKHAIYEFLYSSYGQRYCKYLRSHRYRRRKQKDKKNKRTLIPHKISIHERPEVKNEYGHFEADTIISGKKTKSKTAISAIYELKAMHIDARKIRNLSPKIHTKAQINMLKKFEIVRSVTEDNGIENVDHELLKKQFNAGTYFCDPHSPWQKPGIENANKLIRRFIPRGADINIYSPAFIRSQIKKLNDTPRKALDWRTPNEVIKIQNLLKNQ